jgi:hypothetical protein
MAALGLGLVLSRPSLLLASVVAAAYAAAARSATAPEPQLVVEREVDETTADPGDVVQVTTRVVNEGGTLLDLRLFDGVPEGLSVIDIDDDGRKEIVAGPNVFHPTSEGMWEREEIASGWEWTRVGVADIDGDGTLEVILAEGDRPYNGTSPGRVGWFDPPEWTPNILADDCYCPHTLQVAHLDGEDPPDIYVAEMGLDRNSKATHYWFRNRGDGTFDRQILATDVPTHEAKLVDLDRNGTPDIVGKSYTPAHHVDAWYLDF